MKKKTTNNQEIDLDCSFDQPIPAAAVNDIAYGDDNEYVPYQPIPVKKLVDVFDSMAKVDGHMKVFVRVRPISKDAESTIKVESITKIVTTATETSKRAQYTKQTERQYSFNYVFGPESTQRDVFGETVKPLINRFLLGESGLVIAYGMTNSGKTYTIQGREETPGLLPLLIAELLDRTRNSPGCSVHMSMLEVYQDKIYDLQDPSKTKLQLRDGNGVVEVPKLSLHPVMSPSDVVRLLQSAANNRSKSQTRLNAGSSRSHALYTVQLIRAAGAPGGSGKESSMCTFQVVDLAGSERGNRTKATGSQQREANNINMSLMQLWRCLKLMRHNTCSSAPYSSSSVTAAVATEGNAGPQPAPILAASAPLPFRDSTLTHLLMPALSRVGLKGIVMITCVNPHVDDYDETVSILGNASLAIQIKEVADVNRTGGPVAPSASAVIKQSIHNAAAAASSSRASSSVTAAATVVAQSANTSTAEPSTKNSLGAIKPAVSGVGGGAGASKKRPLESSSRQTHGRKASTNRKTSSIVDISQPLATLAEMKGKTEAADSDDDTVLEAETTTLREESDESSEIKRLRLDVSRLHDENKVLQATQIVREAEIRIEVSKEMEEVSSKLLEQIEELQAQLDSRNTEYVDVAQSCKKIRRKLVNRANADDAREHLNEAEAEALRAKQAYEEEISRLKAEISHLETELAEYRKIEKTKRTMSRSVSSSYIAAVTDKENLASKDSSCRSSRSPLGPLDGNAGARVSSSPIKLENLASVSVIAAAVSMAPSAAPPRNLLVPALKIMAPSAQGSQATAAAAKASLRSRMKAAAAAAAVEESAKQESRGQDDAEQEEPCSILSPMSVLKNHPYVRRLRTRQIRA